LTRELPFLVINLDRSRDRWKSIENQAKAAGIQLERVPAVDGNAIPDTEWVNFDRRKFYLCHGRRPIGAEYGCYMSHIHALQRIVDQNIPYAVILEDDAGIPQDAVKRLQAIIDSGLRFDVVKLYNHRTKGFVTKAKTSEGDELGRCIHGPLGSSMGYLVTRDGAQRLLDTLLPMFLPYDVALERGWKGGVRIYLTREPVIRPAQIAVSTIGSYAGTKFPRILRIPTAFFRGVDYLSRTVYALKG